MQGVSGQMASPCDLRSGDVVAVRSLDEVLATLDADAKFDAMPFMPEMAQFRGMTFQVRRRAEKTCVEGLGMRSLRNTVFLDGLRCNGSAHAGCQRGCTFFWKEAWLTTVGSGQSPVASADGPKDAAQDIEAASQQSRRPYPPDRAASPIQHLSELPTMRGDRFYCQSTELAGATSEYSMGKWHCYLRDLRIREIALQRFAYILWRALLNRIWRLVRGREYYELTGEQQKTLSVELDLQPGEWVEVKSAAEIQATLDENGRNRGLEFDHEMLLHCGRRYRVAMPLRNIILEQNGMMVHLANTVLLEGIACQGICAANCPRANYLYWREIWLNRV